MKAIVYARYGPPDVLQYLDIDKPVPADDQVLIKVHAASVNPYDWHFLRGTPTFIRLFTGLSKPKSPRLGADLAGIVESAGKLVTRFKPGDTVFGTATGSFAEYACAQEKTLALKPEKLSFSQAAAIPIAGVTALQGLRDSGKLRTGQSVLINGAAGGVGTFSVQLAKHFGANVTGVCSTRNLDLVRSLGADRVIDYTRTDFTESGEQYDVLFDLVGNRKLLRASACTASRSYLCRVRRWRSRENLCRIAQRHAHPPTRGSFCQSEAHGHLRKDPARRPRHPRQPRRLRDNQPGTRQELQSCRNCGGNSLRGAVPYARQSHNRDFLADSGSAVAAHPHRRLLLNLYSTPTEIAKFTSVCVYLAP